MEKFLIGVCYLCLCFSCQQNEIEVYAESPRIGFENTSTLGFIPERYITFTDEDYLAQVTEKIDSVKIELMGMALEEPRICCLKKVNESTEISFLQIDFPDRVTVEPGIYSFYLSFKVFRPEHTGMEYSFLLEFDTEHPEHGFDPGKIECGKVRFIVAFNLKPAGWNNYFGTYSDGKYRFMLDFFGGVYSSIGNTSENRRMVREAYAEYRLTHSAILDEDGNEIIFP